MLYLIGLGKIFFVFIGDNGDYVFEFKVCFNGYFEIF